MPRGGGPFSVTVMKYLTSLNAALAAGIDLVGEVTGLSKTDLLKAGTAPKMARDLLALNVVYFGKTRFSRFQREARSTTHDLLTLLAIERHCKKLKKSKDAWALRVELAHTPAGEIGRVARQRIDELQPRKAEEPSVKIRRGPQDWKITVTGSSHDISRIWEGQDGSLDTFVKTHFSDNSAPTTTVNVIVTLDEMDEIVEKGGEEVILRCTNGSTMTGAELVNATLADRGYVALVHPVEGAINLYRTARFANPKQRRLAEIMNSTCSWEGCNRPASECQMHHVVSFNNGGETNQDNIVPACGYHNGVNEDDPGFAPRGRMAKHRGVGGWLPPGETNPANMVFNRGAYKHPAA